MSPAGGSPPGAGAGPGRGARWCAGPRSAARRSRARAGRLRRAAATAAAAAAVLGGRLLGHGHGQLPGHLGLRCLQLALGVVGLAEERGLAGLIRPVPRLLLLQRGLVGLEGASGRFAADRWPVVMFPTAMPEYSLAAWTVSWLPEKSELSAPGRPLP